MINSENFFIPEGCRDQHLVMVPEFATIFKNRGIRGVGIHEVVKGYKIKRLSFPWHMVLIVISGNLKFKKNNLITDINSGDIWIGPANTPHEYWADENCMFISSALFVEEDFYHLEKNITHRKTRFKVSHLFTTVEAYLYESLIAGGKSTGMVAPIADYISNSILREIKTDSMYKTNRLLSSLENLWEKVNAAPGYKWNVKELAEDIYVSTRQFQRLMQTNYGFTAEKMLRKIRMEHASELLKGTNLTVEDISDRVGYESVYAFSRAFRQYYNKPPGAYRKGFLLEKQ
tara:strand:- start:12 stop:875 length:864 start_codon:yes stop_codon:yes gene_type:complete